MKTSWRHLCKTSRRCLEDVFARCLEDVLITFWRCLENILKTFWRCFCRMSSIRLEYLLARRLEDLWPRRIYWSRTRRHADVLKTCSEDVWVRRICLSLSRRLEDVLLRRRRNVFKTSSIHLHQDEYLLGVNWNKYQSKVTIQAPNQNLDYFIDTSFQRVKRLLVLLFESK